MIRLFFDVETSGLADFNKRASDPTQPHIVSYGGILEDTDSGEIEEYDLLSKPDGWDISQETINIHGITNEYAWTMGQPEAEVAAVAVDLVKRANEIVAFNLQFDKFLIRIAGRRYGCFTDTDDAAWKNKPSFCCMRKAAPIVKGQPGARFVKLSEAYRFAFNEDFDGAHSAMPDARAARRLFQWLEHRVNRT